MSDFQSILDEPDEDVTPDSPSSEPAVETPAVEAAGTREEPALDAAPETGTAPASTPITRDDGATWSENAKRWYKDGKIVAGEPPTEPSIPKVDQVAASTTPAPVAPEAPKAPEAPVAAEPFPIRVNGQRILVPGITVAPEHQDTVRALLVDAFNHRQNFPRLQAEAKQRERVSEARTEAVKAKYNGASVYLLDQVEQLLAEQPERLNMVRREVALMLREADLALPKAEAQSEQEVDLEPAARATLSGYLTELMEDLPGAKLLSAEDKQTIGKAFQRRLNAYFEEHEGEPALDTHKVKEDFEYELSIHTRAHQARETAARDAEKTAAAARFNAAQTSRPSQPPTPPKPKPVVATAPSGKGKSWDQAVKDVWNTDDDE